MGNSAASVLPDPVGATMRTCEPARISDSARACISFNFEIPARWSNCVGPVPSDLFRFFVSNNARDRTRVIRTVRKARRTYRSALARSRARFETTHANLVWMIADSRAELRLLSELRLDESACLLIWPVCFPDCDRVLLTVIPDKTQVYPRPPSIETPLFYDPEILRSKLTVLTHSKRLEMLKPGLLCGCGWKTQRCEFSFEFPPSIDIAYQDESLCGHEQPARR